MWHYCFLSYVFFGEYAPDIIAWQGASFNKAMSHMWLSQEGVFGIGLGVSTGFIYLFVLFGALLEKAGAGNYFTQVAFALLGHYRNVHDSVDEKSRIFGRKSRSG